MKKTTENDNNKPFGVYETDFEEALKADLETDFKAEKPYEDLTITDNFMYAKANSSSIIKEMIEIATNKTFAENYAQKHNTDAKYGWYRYDTRFAIPIYDDSMELVRYNVFLARILVRHATDGKLYLYDILRTKKRNEQAAWAIAIRSKNSFLYSIILNVFNDFVK